LRSRSFFQRARLIKQGTIVPVEHTEQLRGITFRAEIALSLEGHITEPGKETFGCCWPSIDRRGSRGFGDTLSPLMRVAQKTTVQNPNRFAAGGSNRNKILIECDFIGFEHGFEPLSGACH
jgi:hypothetical protein